MKKISLFIIFFYFLFNANAQLSAVDYKSDKYNSFKASKTYLVLTGDSKFDSEIQNAVKDLWKVTPYEIIVKEEDFKSKIQDPSASFILLITIGTQHAQQNYHYLALINGGKKNISKYSYDDMLAYCPINHFQNESKNTDCAYRVRNMIESMVLSMDIIQKNDIRGNSKNIADSLREYYNKRSKKIKDRVLLFCDETLGNKITKSDIAGIYPYKFEICNREKIEQVIKEKSTQYYYYQPGITLNKSMFVFDPSNGEVLYFDFQIMGLNINTKNLEDLANTVKGKK
jgi:hypothetical protein